MAQVSKKVSEHPADLFPPAGTPNETLVIQEDPPIDALIEAVRFALEIPLMREVTAPVWCILIDDRPFAEPPHDLHGMAHRWMAPIFNRLNARWLCSKGTKEEWAVIFVHVDGPLLTMPPIWAMQTVMEVVMCFASAMGGRHLLYLDTDAAPGLTFSIAELASWATTTAGCTSAVIGAGAHLHDMFNAGWLLLPGQPNCWPMPNLSLEQWVQEWVLWQARVHCKLHLDPALQPHLMEARPAQAQGTLEAVPLDDPVAAAVGPGHYLSRATAEYLQRRAAFNNTPLADIWIQDPECFLVAWGIFRHTVAPAFPQDLTKTGAASWPCLARHTALFRGASQQWKDLKSCPERWAGPLYDQASVEIVGAICPPRACQLVHFPGNLGGMYHPPTRSDILHHIPAFVTPLGASR